MDDDRADMTWESSSVSSEWNENPEAIASRGDSSINLDERLRDVVDSVNPGCDQCVDGGTERTGGDEFEDAADSFDPNACFSFDSESDDEVCNSTMFSFSYFVCSYNVSEILIYTPKKYVQIHYFVRQLYS